MAVDDRFQAQFAALVEQREAQRADAETLRGGGGGGTSGGVTDDWKASVDAQLKQLHDDIRRLTGYIIAGTIGPFLVIIGVIITLAFQTNTRVDAVNSRIDARFDPLQRQVEQLRVDQARMEGKIDLLLRSSAAGQPLARSR